MTTKADYTPEEWQGLVRAPLLAGAYIVFADISLLGMIGEMKGLFEAIKTQTPPETAVELVSSVVGEIVARDRNTDEDPLGLPTWSKKGEQRPQILALLLKDIAVLDTRSTPAERTGFHIWLLQLALATARAGKEGGLLGLGAVQVSDREQAGLAGLRQALGVTVAGST